jgi:hypothetical protein
MTSLAQLSLALDPTPAPTGADPTPAPPPRPTHRYAVNSDRKVICKRCTTERRQSPTGRRGGFLFEWRVLVEGKWNWTTDCPPCVPADRPARRCR